MSTQSFAAYWYDSPEFRQGVSSVRISTAAYQNAYSANDAHVAMALERMAEVERLIRCHTGPLERPNYRAPTADSMDPILTSLGTCWLLTRDCWELRPDVGARMLSLLRQAHEHGASLEGKSYRGLPVLFSVAMSKRHTAQVLAGLIELGANPDSVPNGSAKLVKLCADRCGAEGAALVTEALMRRRLACESAAQLGIAMREGDFGTRPRRRSASL